MGWDRRGGELGFCGGQRAESIQLEMGRLILGVSRKTVNDVVRVSWDGPWQAELSWRYCGGENW